MQSETVTTAQPPLGEADRTASAQTPANVNIISYLLI